MYHLLINSNPSYPFLLHNNSLLQNKLILPHLFPHSHFFKNNSPFQNTKPHILESISPPPQPIKQYQHIHRTKQLHSFLHPLFPFHHHIHPSLLPSKLTSNLHHQNQYQHHKPKPQTPYHHFSPIHESKTPHKNKTINQFPPNPQKHIF
ncbi:SpoVR family protein, partial [Bacillus altitudinis]|uniref:SpoVR family protein n=1 Tax=Bacillus altitudinis TaxID=293387 RepID=UPI003B5165FA